jgi:hypothetical protein
MKPMTTTAIALILGLVFGPLATCAHARVVFNYNFDRRCDATYAGAEYVTHIVPDQSPANNNLGMGMPVRGLPGRPGHGLALTIDDNDDHPFLGIYPHRADAPGRPRNHFAFMTHVNVHGQSGIMEEPYRTWLTVDAKDYPRSGVWIRLPNGRLVVRTMRSTIRISFGQWHHLATSYNGRTLSIYVNGQLAATRLVPRGRLVNSDVPMRFARTFNSQLNGSMDDTRLFDTALPQTSIQRQMITLNRLPKPCPTGTREIPAPTAPIEDPTTSQGPSQPYVPPPPADTDRDGIPDAADNCPTLFNPSQLATDCVQEPTAPVPGETTPEQPPVTEPEPPEAPDTPIEPPIIEPAPTDPTPAPIEAPTPQVPDEPAPEPPIPAEPGASAPESNPEPAPQ